LAVNDDWPPQSSIATGLRCACPRCGKGCLYYGLLKIAGRCGVCGLDYGRLGVDDGPAFFIIVGYSALVIPLAVALEFAAHPPFWMHALIWIPVVLGGAVGLMRPLKAWLAAQKYKHAVWDEEIGKPR